MSGTSTVDRLRHARSRHAALAVVVTVFAVLGPLERAGAAQSGGSPSPQISVDDVRVTEGTNTASSAVFTVRLDSPTGRIITVSYTTEPGTATPGSDYTPSSGTVTFNKRQTVATVTIAVYGDTIDEDDETFALRLSNPGGGAVIARETGTATILDDDEAPPPPSRISVNDVSVNEGSIGQSSAVFTVQLDRAASSTVSVGYETGGGTASPGADYALQAGTVTFAPGQASMHVTVPVVADTTDEPDETFELRLTDPGGSVELDDATGVATITDDDEPAQPPEPPADLSIAISATSATGGDYVVDDSHTVTFAFENVTSTVARDVVVRLTFDSDHAPAIVEDLAACALSSASEMVCSYGTTSAGDGGSFTVLYSHAKSYTVNATVESATPDPATGNNTRTAVMNVRDRRSDVRIVAIGGGDSVERVRSLNDNPYNPSAQVENVFVQNLESPCILCGDDDTPNESQLVLGNLGPDPVRGVTVDITGDPGQGIRPIFATSRVDDPYPVSSCIGGGTLTLTCTIDVLPVGASAATIYFDLQFPRVARAYDYGAVLFASITVPANADGTAIDADTTDNQADLEQSAVQYVHDVELSGMWSLYDSDGATGPEEPREVDCVNDLQPQGDTCYIQILNAGPAAAFNPVVRIAVPWNAQVSFDSAYTPLGSCTMEIDAPNLRQIWSCREGGTGVSRFASHHYFVAVAVRVSWAELLPTDQRYLLVNVGAEGVRNDIDSSNQGDDF
jgi:hypothetical protein